MNISTQCRCKYLIFVPPGFFVVRKLVSVDRGELVASRELDCDSGRTGEYYFNLAIDPQTGKSIELKYELGSIGIDDGRGILYGRQTGGACLKRFKWSIDHGCLFRKDYIENDAICNTIGVEF